jgi:hypothetical protein
MRRTLLALLAPVSLMLAACGGATTGVSTASAVSLGGFDVTLYGWEAWLNAGKLTPGSEKAKGYAKHGRELLAGIQFAHIARQVGVPNPALDELYDKVVAHAEAVIARLEGPG